MQHNRERDDTPPHTPSYLSQPHSRSVSNGSPASSYRRRHTPTPSFMNYQNGAAARAVTNTSPSASQTRVDTTPPASTKSRPARTLLLAFADAPPSSTVRTVERLLKSQRVTTIAILANTQQEQRVKDLKIQLYSLVGQMQQEIGVYMYLRPSWTTEEYQTTVKQVDQVSTVLCAPSFESTASNPDILSVTPQDVSDIWRQSFDFLHTIAKATFPRLTETGEDDKTMFAVMASSKPDSSSAAKVCQAGCESLLAQLSGQYASKGVQVGQVEQLLPPERKPVSLKKQSSVSNIDIPTPQQVKNLPAEGGESPTRLYEMWTMHEEFIP